MNHGVNAVRFKKSFDALFVCDVERVGVGRNEVFVLAFQNAANITAELTVGACYKNHFLTLRKQS